MGMSKGFTAQCCQDMLCCCSRAKTLKTEAGRHPSSEVSTLPAYHSNFVFLHCYTTICTSHS